MLSRIQILYNAGRIFSTIIFGLFAIAVLVLWIRSYKYAEGGMVSTIPGQHIAFNGGLGRMCVWFEHTPAPVWYDWHRRDLMLDDFEPVEPGQRIPVFDLAFFWPKMTRLYVAHWFLFIAASLVAIGPWFPRQFTTRGLFIALTIGCMVIALICWVDHLN